MNTQKQLTEEREKIGSWGHLAKSRIKSILRFSGKAVLDIGCSTGSYVNFLRNRGYTAWGMDVIHDNHWGINQHSLFQIGDIHQLPYQSNSFDTVLAFEVLEHLENPDAALKEMHRVTRNNIIISVPNCSQPEAFKHSGLAFHHWIDRTHKQAFTLDSLRERLETNGFKITAEQFINPVYPDILSLSSWHLPVFLAKVIGRILHCIPIRKKFHMSILVVAAKKNEKG